MFFRGMLRPNLGCPNKLKRPKILISKVFFFLQIH
ncbi:hypothetical protein CWS_00070 [Buchnera aphidicola str. JF99 (Acyrthosiphon pisum)]|nr:hypothetical protein CWO_00070 [Buchnera aphidicola str. LL01 (Acyrthosiphon pisum)]ADP66422.1 hypothetical protein CWQ_00075 [Buchnera aphidicola str. TLW03 (Acyrthosiphon pisum)]ADP66996.1 hypothetical protein CWS_00070 [Buchnera aphidicola str. JF99 (Acyrthosiphon pisum)]